jgi:hypothetical protein
VGIGAALSAEDLTEPLTAGQDLVRRVFAAGSSVRWSAGTDNLIDNIAIIRYTAQEM